MKLYETKSSSKELLFYYVREELMKNYLIGDFFNTNKKLIYLRKSRGVSMEIEKLKMELLKSEESSFINSIKEKFMINKEGSNIEDIEANIKVLAEIKIDVSVKSLIIARINSIISSFEGHSLISAVVGLLLTVLSFVIGSISPAEIESIDFGVKITLLVFSIVLLLLLVCQLHNLLRQKHRKDIAVYFKTLLEEIDEKNN